MKLHLRKKCQVDSRPLYYVHYTEPCSWDKWILDHRYAQYYNDILQVHFILHDSIQIQ